MKKLDKTHFPLSNTDLGSKAYGKIFSLLDETMSANTNHYLLVSGGSDSMCLAHLIFDYFFTTGLDMSRLFVLHYNHQQRGVSTEEEKFIKEYFSNYTYIAGTYTGGGSTERELRKARRQFVVDTIRYHGNGLVYTGHHLQDRFETSCLHMIRGCKQPGIKNMTHIDNLRVGGIDLPLVRPLLSLEKKQIIAHCLENNIPYVIDGSNTDITLSQRNKLRQRLGYFLGDLPYMSTGIRQLYTYFDNTSSPQVIYCPLTPHPSWGVSLYYKTTLPNTADHVYILLSSCGIVGGITSSRIQELLRFFTHARSGWKYLRGRYMCICHGYLYLSYSGDLTPFRYTPPEGSLHISHVGSYTLNGRIRNIQDKLYIGATLRYMKTGDVYKGKKLAKKCINKKIPFFYRPTIPVIEKEGEILHVLFDQLSPCSF